MINNGKGLLDQIQEPKYTSITEIDIKNMIEDLYLKSNNEERQITILTGAGRNIRNRNKTNGRYEKGFHYVKGGMDYFNEALEEQAKKFLDEPEFERVDPRIVNSNEYDNE